jgi:NADH-quinone oxidoreductase subunit C
MRPRRFDVVYHLYSLSKGHLLRVKAAVGEAEQIDSVTPVWKGANWTERETYDMYGVRFANHPDLRRILLTDNFEGYPFRKDYPLAGYEG